MHSRQHSKVSHVINRALYYYRYNKNGISKSEYSTKFDVVLKHNLVNEQYLIRKYPELKKQAEAMVASGCFGMMLKILKTPKGYEQFWKQFRENKQCYLKRIKEYFTLCCNSPKDWLWMAIILCCNRVTIRLLRIAGIVN